MDTPVSAYTPVSYEMTTWTKKEDGVVAFEGMVSRGCDNSIPKRQFPIYQNDEYLRFLRLPLYSYK
jgi:hypothetical protein